MVCFSELVPEDKGPRRVSEADVRATFGETESPMVTKLERAEIQSNRNGSETRVPAWLARIARVQDATLGERDRRAS